MVTRREAFRFASPSPMNSSPGVPHSPSPTHHLAFQYVLAPLAQPHPTLPMLISPPRDRLYGRAPIIQLLALAIYATLAEAFACNGIIGSLVSKHHYFLLGFVGKRRTLSHSAANTIYSPQASRAHYCILFLFCKPQYILLHTSRGIFIISV